jgi:hypothetical protein
MPVMLAPPVVTAPEAGAIRDARARQRRHRRIGIGALAALAAVALGLGWGGGGGTARAQSGAPTLPLSGPRLGRTGLRLLLGDVPPRILDVDVGTFAPVAVPHVTDPAVSVEPAPGGAFAIASGCSTCGGETGYFVGANGSVGRSVSADDLALDPGTSRVWVLDRGPGRACTLRLEPGGSPVRAPCGPLGGSNAAGVQDGNAVVDPATGTIRFRAPQSLELDLLAGDLALESNTGAAFNGEPGHLTLIDLATGARRRVTYPRMPRSASSDYFALQHVVVEPHGPLAALIFANPWYAPGQAAYIWILDSRTGSLTLLPGFPVREGVKFSNAAWTADGRLVVVSATADRTSGAMRTALGVWSPGAHTMPVRTIPSRPGPAYWDFVPLGG